MFTSFGAPLNEGFTGNEEYEDCTNCIIVRNGSSRECRLLDDDGIGTSSCNDCKWVPDDTPTGKCLIRAGSNHTRSVTRPNTNNLGEEEEAGGGGVEWRYLKNAGMKQRTTSD